MRPLAYARSEAISSSEIKALIEGTPYAFQYKKLSDPVIKDCFIEGQYLHCMWLEPEELSNRYFIIDDLAPQNTKAGKAKKSVSLEAYTEAAKINPNLEPISARIVEKCKTIHNAAKNHPLIKWLLSVGDKVVERPITDAPSMIDGVMLKCIPDFVSASNRLVVDFKHMGQGIGADQFSKDAANRHYHIQSVLNCMCVAHKYLGSWERWREFSFEYVCISKEEPFEVARYTLDDLFLDIAEYKIKRALSRFKYCKDQGRFPSYPFAQAVVLSAPKWLK